MAKYGRFYEVTWKFGLFLLSRAEIFAKIKRFCWSDLKIWPAPTSQAGIFAKITYIWWCHWKIELALLSLGKILAKIRQFSWCELNIWPSPITSGNFRKNKADLLKRFGNLNCVCYCGLKFSQKWDSFNGITWKFELPLSRAESFAKISHI